MPKDVKEFVFAKDGKVLTDDTEFVNTIELKGSRQKSYLVSKISIKSTVFGIIVLSKREENFYTNADLDALNAAASVLSYVLKDLELSNVFKLQLKALKDGILEKNQAYKTIKEQNEKILEADRVKNEFLANISHELRTPLNSILGFADILGTQLYGAFFISRAVDEVCNILLPLAQKKNVTLKKDMTVDFEVFADYQKIQQILYNLVSNAIKYSPENDTVDISIKADDEKFTITVHDNGIGIDEKYHGKIFAKFVQLDSAYTKKESSTGLGLTITKELVELHEGKISLKSEVNNGSTFIVEIPF